MSDNQNQQPYLWQAQQAAQLDMRVNRQPDQAVRPHDRISVESRIRPGVEQMASSA
jgi:hypothetical protein